MTNINLKKQISTSVIMVLVFIGSLFLTSCDLEYDLPEAGSKEDLTPPTANFSVAVTDYYLTYNFANLSTSATDYLWDFGDGNSSTSVDGKNTYPDEGTYTITLIASDKLGVSSTYSSTIEVVEPPVPLAIVPLILNPSFDEPGDDGKYLLPWVADSSIGKTPQSSSSSSFIGGRAAKFPTALTDARIGYQKDIAVTPNTDYVITYYYSIEIGDPSTIIVAILGGNISDASEVAGATIKSFEGTTQAGKTPFEKVDLAFNSGNNSIISIHISNTGPQTSYIEEFSAAIAE